MKTKLTIFFALATMICVPVQQALAHCQVPCGIYGDETRFTIMEEHITTIEKSMNQIVELSNADDKNYNQIVRWVNNKETHADEFTDIVTYYFLAQRIKADAEKYEEKLVLLHGLMVSAMKAKQTTDLANISALRDGLKEFRTLYLGKSGLAHLKEHSAGGDAETAMLDAEAGCAMCSFKIAGASNCETAVKVAGKSYVLQGVDLNAHKLGLCKKTRPAHVSGKVDGEMFVASTFDFTDK